MQVSPARRFLHPYRCAFLLCEPPSPTDCNPLSLHDALPISSRRTLEQCPVRLNHLTPSWPGLARPSDRKSTRLNSSHVAISYAVFCLKKKNHRLAARRFKLHSRHVKLAVITVQTSQPLRLF